MTIYLCIAFNMVNTYIDYLRLRKYWKILNQIKKHREEIKQLTNNCLKIKTTEFKKRIKSGISLDQILPETFAVASEAAERVLGLNPYDVQMIGGIVLHEGKIAEMKTGEGKSLAASFPAYLNALTEKGVHIITVNDYLARRDYESIGKIFEFLGMKVGLINQYTPISKRKNNYLADITYVTNSEIGFDYLRDNMATQIKELTQRPFHFCIIDEVDSILIDESRTPLIISGRTKTRKDKYELAHRLANFLKKSIHYKIDEKNRTIILSDLGVITCEKILKIKSIYSAQNTWAHFIYNALKAKELYLKNVHYIVRDQQAIIVDEFTGRIMPERRWADGLHQSIEAKENLQIKEETKTLASITYQNLFLLYLKISGMTGTAKTEENELISIYSLPVICIPTYKSMIRKDLPDLIFQTEIEKLKAVTEECVKMHLLGRPILVGTTNIQKSEILSQLLNQYQIRHNLLNAKPQNVKRESEIIAQAGRKYAVTISTNMAGRGTDIILGGNLEYIIKNKITSLFKPIILTGNTQYIIIDKSLKSSGNEIRDINSNILKIINLHRQNPKLTIAEFGNSLNIASKKIKSNNEYILNLRSIYIIFENIYKKYFDIESKEVKNIGGLCVIGTERHESRRIDNQLRGRSGRQGDVGSSIFFISLEDNLLRIFGGERISKMMHTFMPSVNEPIQSPLLSRSLDSAQKKVESLHYNFRKQLFQYDQILNSQRKAIYLERRLILESNEIVAWTMAYMELTIIDILNDQYLYSHRKPRDKVLKNINKIYDLLASPISLIKIEKYTFNKKTILKQLKISYDLKKAQIDKTSCGLMKSLERSLILEQIDTNWSEHIQQMSFLKEFIGWRGYAQKDPLIEYKNESYILFIKMIRTIRQNILYLLFRAEPTLDFS
uniref:Protein translocase subunit SecA n=1 Tax=Cyanidium caldarium TaxID=2771 RepID=SECA_CYACA|nr:preprotein translocase subunit SecA [Cyanidium caldarium]O19911.1 RecName: Full=Protein translocase subunit SecA [Cyanidium caldarium]AAB82678.1 unknown [Cyanidium caldarium]